MLHNSEYAKIWKEAYKAESVWNSGCPLLWQNACQSCRQLDKVKWAARAQRLSEYCSAVELDKLVLKGLIRAVLIRGFLSAARDFYMSISYIYIYKNSCVYALSETASVSLWSAMANEWQVRRQLATYS